MVTWQGNLSPLHPKVILSIFLKKEQGEMVATQFLPERPVPEGSRGRARESGAAVRGRGARPADRPGPAGHRDTGQDLRRGGPGTPVRGRGPAGGSRIAV